MINDPIGDLIVRLRNAAAAGRDELNVPSSKLKEAVLKILKTEGIIEEVAKKNVEGHDTLVVSLKTTGKAKLMPQLVRVSTPGRRIYVKAKDIPRPLKGYGLVVLSTPLGVLTGQEARRKGVGGEILFAEK